jgi:hypothetical protein
LAVGAVAAFALVTKDAHALGPVDLEIAARAGVGSTPGGGGPNPLGLGLGARGGVQILGLYGGLSIMNYFGESQDETFGTFSAHSLLYGVEAGYGSKLLDLITLRGTVGVGNYSETVEVKQGAASGPSATANSLYVEPGVLAMLTLGSFLVGADANVLVLPSRTNSDKSTGFDAAFTLHAQVGIKF